MKYPYLCRIIDVGREFIPTMIDYENRQVWRQRGQASGNGEWISFDDLVFRKNKEFSGINEV